MRIKSTVLQWLAAGCGGVGLLYALGIEGSAQVGAPITDGQFITAMALILAAIALARLSFAVEKAEKAAKPRYGKIERDHARNPEYPALPERSSRRA